VLAVTLHHHAFLLQLTDQAGDSRAREARTARYLGAARRPVRAQHVDHLETVPLALPR
jgi:hypothetical protein